VGLSGCAATADLPPEETTEQIIGGTDDTGDPAVAALYAREPGAEQGSLCTATLINPTTLITAAHCVKPSLIGDNVEILAIFHPVLQGSPESTRKRVREVHFDPAFNENDLQNGHDVAVAILEQPVTDIAPIPWRRTPLDSSFVNSDVRLVGYGLNDGFGQTGAGTKREITVQIGSVDPKIIQVGNFGATSCNGDSGGPALVNIDGVETLVGVTSFGIIFCIGPGSYTNVGTYVDEILAWGGGSCTPSCGGKECGNDGCGGECGRCDDGESCTDSPCVPRGGGCDDGTESEPNDEYVAASEVCGNDHLEGALASRNDIDYFVFMVGRNQRYTVSIDGIDPNLVKGYLKKWGTASNKLLNVGYLDPDGSDARSISKSTQTGGTNYLKVYNFPGTAGSTRPYTVSVDIQ